MKDGEHTILGGWNTISGNPPKDLSLRTQNKLYLLQSQVDVMANDIKILLKHIEKNTEAITELQKRIKDGE